MVPFALFPHVVEGVRKLSGIAFKRVWIPFTKTPPSSPNHLLKPHPLTRHIWDSAYEGSGTHTFSLWHLLAPSLCWTRFLYWLPATNVIWTFSLQWTPSTDTAHPTRMELEKKEWKHRTMATMCLLWKGEEKGWNLERKQPLSVCWPLLPHTPVVTMRNFPWVVYPPSDSLLRHFQLLPF